MSKKKNRLGSSEEILSKIGSRMSSQNSKKKTEDENKNDNSSDKNEEKNNDQQENSSNDEKKETEAVNNSWLDEQKPYRSSFIVKPDMEDNFEDCKRKFRKELRMNLSKQNAIELGWLLLKKLDKEYFSEVKRVSSPDDDLVESLKKIIKEFA
ncbi:hypothetical protein C8C76_1597 [Halanaerobium saccharolyticum]|jgi:hypothetical protein|uniref:Uncharacterized protein n=1 Tax=Halanaerobium saccharolyticum TaxID=43595 RepID=A0A2T5RF69_9FIRM|nr:hypothetical protein [Halanaerobium saccharolyticum]PTV92985.1 hypothetical protein C8C76_1597 [Halanaerobium saccharolyticum]